MWPVYVFVIVGTIREVVMLQQNPLADGRESTVRQDTAHEFQYNPALPHHIHIDLDYDKLLRSFGVPENISVVLDSFSSISQQDAGSEELDIPAQSRKHKNRPDKPRSVRCKSLQCDTGRVCHVWPESGKEECVCRERCSSRRNPVCGSDGNWYHNLCELHRISCRGNRVIHVAESHDGTCGRKQSHSEQVITRMTADPMHHECSKNDYAAFKENLLLYFYEKLVPLYKREESAMDKRKLLRDMLDNLDENRDEVLSQHELQSTGREFNQISEKCHLDDLLRNEDSDENGLIALSELFTSYGLPVGEPFMPLTQKLWTVNVGNSIEIPCSILGATTSVTWERNHVNLNDREYETGLRMGNSGSLYFTHAQLLHTGNYSCFTEKIPDAIEYHTLRVLLTPQVEVAPRQHFYRLHENASIKCHAVGIPHPTVRWLKNEHPVQQTTAKLLGNGSLLLLSNLAYKDTGVYSCRAENDAGVTSDISSVFIVKGDKENKYYRKLFMVFYSKGIAFYEPAYCRVRFHIQSMDIIPGTNDYVCGHEERPCEWGDAVNVMDRYVYASQPLLNRIIAISLEQIMVVQVIYTDKIPVKLSYVPHLDQLWVLCWTTVGNTPVKTIQVIRDASVKTLHAAIHPEPLFGKYETVDDFFIPAVQELAHKFTHAYAVHSDGNKLYKVDMRSLRFVRTIDLRPYRCHPRRITYSTFGGLVFLDCVDMLHGTPRGQIIMDYLTDAVLRHDETINGLTLISPDSRYWVNMGTDVIRVQEIGESGLDYLYDVVTTLHISDVTFHPSHFNHSYDLYATALTRDTLLTLDIGHGRLSTLQGIGSGTGKKFNHWGSPDARFICSSGLFSSYIVTAARDAVFVVNTESKTVNCQIGGLNNPQKAVWIEYPSPLI